MRIFEVNNEINRIFEEGVDPTTGVISDEALAELERLQITKEQKIENLLMAYKNEKAMADAIEAEIALLKTRLDTHTNKANGIKAYAEYVLQGETFETAKVKVSYRNSESVEVPKNFDWESLKHRKFVIVKKTYAPDKAMLKKLLKEGKTFPFAELVQKRNIQIK